MDGWMGRGREGKRRGVEERCVHAQREIDMDGWIDGRMQGGRGRERGWKREKMEERCAHTHRERERAFN